MSRQDSLFTNQEPKTRTQRPVECLGKTFDSDEARREHFLRILREGLKELHAKLGGVALHHGGRRRGAPEISRKVASL